MQINNEILHDFIVCHYKAYRKSKHQTGIISVYQSHYNQLRQKGKENFERTFTKNNNLTVYHQNCENNAPEEGISLNLKFTNANVDITVDGIEFIGKKNITPIFITPFEKVTTADKLFVSLQASLIETEFNLKIVNCKVIHGKNLQGTQFKLLSTAKNIKKIIVELNKILLSSNEPALFLNRHFDICEFCVSCKEKANTEGNISLLDRATPKVIEKYKKKGIFTIQQLSFLYKPRRRKKRVKQLIAHNLELQALALRTDKIYVLQLPELSRQTIELFLDIEGNPDQELYYLIGVLTCKDDTTISNSFWANKTTDETHIWQQFLSITDEYPDAPIYHYGNYELKAIETLGKWYKTNVTQIQGRLINIVNSIYGKIYFPVYSNRLKELGDYLGATWSSANASGIQSLVWMHQWNDTQDEKFKQILITYNLEDCFALKLLVDNLTEIEKRNNAVTNIHDEIRSDRCPKKSEDKIHQQLTEILSFSYTIEHYNSSKIFFNNDKQERKPEDIEPKRRRDKKLKSLKPTKSIKIRRRIKCPKCGFSPLKESKKTTEKITVDLRFTQETIVKEIRKYWANRSSCMKCNKDFIPPYFNVHGHPGIYGRNIKIWVCYLRIVLRNPYSLIRKITSDLFKLNLSDAVILRFIEEVGSYYLKTENLLISSLLKSKFIHIDETTINIKGQKQYVWVLRNDNSVYLKHTETRGNEFIKNL